LRLCVEVPHNRDGYGTLLLRDGAGAILFGPVPIAARSSDALAAAKGNPARNPLFCYGDTPLGEYRLVRLIDKRQRSVLQANDFGSAALVLSAVSGAAAIAEANGRFEIVLCGGRETREGRIRSTAGAMRLRDRDAAALAKLLSGAEIVTCSVAQRRLSEAGRVAVDAECRMSDPIALPPAAQPASARPLARQMAFGVAVSFAAAAIPAEAVASTRTSAQTPLAISQDSPKAFSPDLPAALLPPTFRTDHGPGFVKLAYNTVGAGSFSDAEAASVVTGQQAVEPKDYGSQIAEVWSDVDKKAVAEEIAGQTVDAMHGIAEKMAEQEAEGAFKQSVGMLEQADTEFRVGNAAVAASALEGVSTALAAKTAWEQGTKVGNAVNDLMDGKIGVSEFAQKVGPVPAELLLQSGALTGGVAVPFADKIVESGIATINYGLDKAIDAGFDMYDKWKGYDVQRRPK
jgi:hypothetical protein